MNKGSFEFHKDWIEVLLSIPDRLRHKVMDAVLLYVSDGTMPTDPKVLYSPFTVIQKQIEQDNEKRKSISAKRRDAGRKGNETRQEMARTKHARNARNAKNANANFANAKNANAEFATISSKEDKDNIVVVVDEGACARVREEAKSQNLDFFKRYFDDNKRASLEQLTMQLHATNPATVTIDDVKVLAKMVIAEWEQNEEPPKKDYTEWSRHLINHIRVKNKINQTAKPNEPTNHNNRPDYNSARQQGDAEFARFAQEKLRGAGLL